MTTPDETPRLPDYRQQLEAIGKNIATVVASVVQFQEFFRTSVAPQLLAFHESLAKGLFPVLKEIADSFNALPPKLKRALLAIGKEGWFLDLSMSLPELWVLEQKLTEGKVSEVELFLISHFESRVDEIQARLSAFLPHRAAILKSAFDAHRRQEYNLSIPVFLAQTDGICKELAKHCLFIKERQKQRPGTAAYVETLVEEHFWYAMLSPLANTLPINASYSERVTGSAELNRHTVLHGEDLEYGTKVNSLKAISLLNYVASVLRDDPPAP